MNTDPRRGDSSREPMVSIVMPAYNVALFIQEAVESVLRQTWSNWELLIVDDGSTDATADYLDSLTDPRIRVTHQENRGVSTARNAALDAANGDFLTFLDADDALSPESLRVRMQHLLENPEIDVLDGAVSIRDPQMLSELRLHEPRYDGPYLPPLLRLDSTVFCHISYLLKRDLARDVRFVEGMTHAEDILFSIHLAARQPLRFGSIADVVYLYRTGHASAMRNLPGLEDGYLKLIKEVEKLPCATVWNMVNLRLRIARIMLFSWRAQRRLSTGVRAAKRALFE